MLNAILQARSLLERVKNFGAEAVGPPPETRLSPRSQAALTAEIITGGHCYPCMVQTVSTGGLSIRFDRMPALVKGAQLLVLAGDMEPISGSVKWIGGDECGMALNRALADDVLKDISALFDPGKRPRPCRERIVLRAKVRAPGMEHSVLVENIGSGGALLSTGVPLPVSLGVMIEIPGLPPVGAHVRWHRCGRSGMMFSKLLPIRIAEEIAERCAINPAWVEEIRTAHSDLANAA